MYPLIVMGLPFRGLGAVRGLVAEIFRKAIKIAMRQRTYRRQNCYSRHFCESSDTEIDELVGK